MPASNGETVPGCRQCLAGSASHPTPFPRTPARQLFAPRSWSRSDCPFWRYHGWIPTDNSTSNRSKLSVCPECTFGERGSGCMYAAVEERGSCWYAFLPQEQKYSQEPLGNDARYRSAFMPGKKK